MALDVDNEKWFQAIPPAQEVTPALQRWREVPAASSTPGTSWFIALDALDGRGPAVLHLCITKHDLFAAGDWLPCGGAHAAAVTSLLNLPDAERALAGKMLAQDAQWNGEAATCKLADKETWDALVSWLLEHGRLFLDPQPFAQPGYVRLKAGETFKPTPEWLIEVDTKQVYIEVGVVRHDISLPWGDMNTYVDTFAGVVGHLPSGWTSALLCHLCQLGRIAPHERAEFAERWSHTPYAALFPAPPVHSDPTLLGAQRKAGCGVVRRPKSAGTEWRGASRGSFHESGQAAGRELAPGAIVGAGTVIVSAQPEGRDGWNRKSEHSQYYLVRGTRRDG